MAKLIWVKTYNLLLIKQLQGATRFIEKFEVKQNMKLHNEQLNTLSNIQHHGQRQPGQFTEHMSADGRRILSCANSFTPTHLSGPMSQAIELKNKCCNL